MLARAEQCAGLAPHVHASVVWLSAPSVEPAPARAIARPQPGQRETSESSVSAGLGWGDVAD